SSLLQSRRQPQSELDRTDRDRALGYDSRKNALPSPSCDPTVRHRGCRSSNLEESLVASASGHWLRRRKSLSRRKRLVQHFLLAAFPPGTQAIAQRSILQRENRNCQQCRIRSPRLADGKRPDRNSLGHLHDGKK